jgi:hypothetical protein
MHPNINKPRAYDECKQQIVQTPGLGWKLDGWSCFFLLLRFCDEALGAAATVPPAPTSQPLHRLRPVALPLTTGKPKRKRWSAFHGPTTRIPRPNYPNSMSRSSLRSRYNEFKRSNSHLNKFQISNPKRQNSFMSPKTFLPLTNVHTLQSRRNKGCQ